MHVPHLHNDGINYLSYDYEFDKLIQNHNVSIQYQYITIINEKFTMYFQRFDACLPPLGMLQLSIMKNPLQNIDLG